MGTNVKQTPIPVVPRNLKMVNADGTPTRSGQLLLQQLQASSTIYGTHDTRPAPGDVPEGALYFETDRGVLYSNQNGNWQYVAGTMYATLFPDQRPTDLGQYDGGFQFVANDTDPANRGRSFIWDGTEWVETTQVLYGLHADRPAVADAPARCLYMETDRGSVIYQNQGTAWQYIAGTMYGTVTSISFTDLQLVAPYPGTVIQSPSRPFVPSDIGALIITGGTGFTPGTYTISGLQYDILGHPTGNAIIVPDAGVAGATGGIGTLPDQRPTDLGPPDAGFDFRTNVDPAREFLWSGGDWVETTPIRYGTHAERLATPVAGLISGMFWTETDRGNVIYELQGGVWLFLTGTMWGTLSPDQRPTDLGVNDDGFTFLATVDPLRSFIWASPVWVESTPALSVILYGTHADRLAVPIATIASGTIWIETDRGNAMYQDQGGTWFLLNGTMWGTLSPDQRPTDLGVNDDGFTFLATVTPLRSFIWASPVWVETTSIAGASALTHPNVVTKVGATGQIVEGGITDASAGNSGSVRITPGGLVGIAGAPAAMLDVNGCMRATGSAAVPATGSGVEIYYTGTGIVQSYNRGTSSTTALYLLGNPIALLAGNVGIGVTGPTHLLELSSDSAAKPATSTWTVFSDLRLKQNVEPVKDDSLAIVNSFNWLRFEYNGQAGTPQGLKAVGLVAQVLRDQLPEAVRSSKKKLKETDAEETDVLAIDYHHIMVHSARAIQQLDVELKSLRALIGKPQS